MITEYDIAARHPWNLSCETDREYAALANDIYDAHHVELGFMEKDEDIRNVCVGMALYFEDLHSETRQFETFAMLYHKMYGRYMPFYDSVDENSPEAELDAANFVLWHCISAERGNNILNPTNSGVRQMARDILNLWKDKKDSIRPNEELADYLYCDETQEDGMEVRNILVWIESKSFLGRWYNNYNYEDDEFDVRELFYNATEEKKQYTHDSLGAFEHQAWPLSLKANHIYAEMIRLEMDDNNDEIAAKVDDMQYEPLGIYHVMKRNNKGVVLRDFKGVEFLVEIPTSDAMKAARKSTHSISSFFEYDGVWYPNGLSIWKNIDGENYKAYVEERRKDWSYFHDYVGQFEDYIKSRNGDRLCFFQSVEECKQWVTEELGFSKTDIIPEGISKHKPFMAFFEPNGQITFMSQPMCISHKDNLSYDKAYAGQEGLCLVSQPNSASPDLTMYLIEHDLLKDVCLNDFRGKEHGRMLLQENIDFVARCTRRDITSTKVCRRRSDLVFNDTEIAKTDYLSKHVFEKFVKLVAKEKSIRSSANKEWRVVRCNSTTTVVRDVANWKEFAFSTKSLHNAHLALSEKDIQIANLVPYVGKECAPAATVVLYNVVGRGRGMNSLRKMADQLFKNIRSLKG